MDFQKDFEKISNKILTENLSENVSTIPFHLGRAKPSKSQLKISLKILLKICESISIFWVASI